MKLLPHSNGVRKVNMKKVRTPQEKLKIVLMSLGIILLIGFVFQKISNFIAKESLKPKVDYTTVDDRRMDFRLEGNGEYTIVFDGAIGGNLEAWTPVVEALAEEEEVNTFVYNRRGYGYSDTGSARTPEEQAQDLKILLRKAGATEPYILVGEEYGAVVLTSFAEQFPDSVAGVVLVDPIVEEVLGTKAYKRSQSFTKFRRKIEDFGSQFGLTTLLDSINLDVEIEDFENKLSSEAQKEFRTQRTKNKYTSAVYNELTNLIEAKSNSQKPGIFNGKPYYLIVKDENTTLENLGDTNLTKVHKTTCEKEFLSLNDSENIVNGIKNVLRQLKDISRAS